MDDFRDDLLVILDKVSTARLPEGTYFEFIIHEDKALCLPNEIGPPFVRIKRALRTKMTNLRKNISDKQLEDALINFLIELKYTPDQQKVKSQILKHVNKLFSDLKSLLVEKWLFLIPITNLRLLQDLEIGDNSLINLNEAAMAQLEAKYSIKFRFTEKDLAEYTNNLIKNNETATFAAVVIDASDQGKALELAFQKGEECLNVLRLYGTDAPFIIRHEHKKNFIATIVRINVTKNVYGEQSSAVNLTDNIAVTLTPEKIISLRKTGLDVINKLLKKKPDELTPLQKDLLIAIMWFGDAVKDDQNRMKLVKSMMALETLLVPDGGQGKANVLAKRFASIVYSNGSLTEKKEAFADMHEMYEIRNDIIHSGEGYVNIDDLNQAMYWTQATIRIISQHAEEAATLQQLLSSKYPIDDSIYGIKATSNEPVICKICVFRALNKRSRGKSTKEKT
jgi:hypothetical protein